MNYTIKNRALLSMVLVILHGQHHANPSAVKSENSLVEFNQLIDNVIKSLHKMADAMPYKPLVKHSNKEEVANAIKPFIEQIRHAQTLKNYMQAHPEMRISKEQKALIDKAMEKLPEPTQLQIDRVKEYIEQSHTAKKQSQRKLFASKIRYYSN